MSSSVSIHPPWVTLLRMPIRASAMSAFLHHYVPPHQLSLHDENSSATSKIKSRTSSEIIRQRMTSETPLESEQGHIDVAMQVT